MEPDDDLLPLPEPVQRDLARLFRNLHNFAPAFENGAIRLARLGWTLPGSMDAREFSRIIAFHGRDEIEERFVDHYTSASAQNLDRLHEDLRRLDCLAPWRQLIDQCVSAFKRQEYAIPVPALLTVIEGLLAACSAKLDRKVSMPQFLRDKVAEAGDKNFTRAFWLSIEEFVNELFRSHSFAQESPAQVNRHWVLHGRSEAGWSAADSLRLLQAIHTIAERCKRAVAV